MSRKYHASENSTESSETWNESSLLKPGMEVGVFPRNKTVKSRSGSIHLKLERNLPGTEVDIFFGTNANFGTEILYI